MLVCIFGTSNGRHMQACFMCECRGTNIRSLRVERAIQNFSYKVAHRGEALHVCWWQALVTQLQLQVRNDGGEVCVTSALAQTVKRSLHVAHAALHCSH